MLNVYNAGDPMVLGMFEEAFEDEVDSLLARSRRYPVSRADVEGLLARYGVRFSDLSTWLRGKVGDIEVID